MAKIHTPSVDRLFEAVLGLESVEECYRFFEDICTIKEVLEMAQRLDTAFLLDEGKNYQTIAQEVGISTATISRVNKCLMYGSDGYRLAIDRLRAAEGNHEDQ